MEVEVVSGSGTVQDCKKCIRTQFTCNETECCAEYRTDGQNVYFIEIKEPGCEQICETD
jgi:hypothetical protein